VVFGLGVVAVEACLYTVIAGAKIEERGTSVVVDGRNWNGDNRGWLDSVLVEKGHLADLDAFNGDGLTGRVLTHILFDLASDAIFPSNRCNGMLNE
jgi:hypothetical protein